MSLVELVVDVHRVLLAAGQAHAFGGALALAYVAEPRGTVDIDVNVFAPASQIDIVLGLFAPLGLTSRASSRRVAADCRDPSPPGA